MHAASFKADEQFEDEEEGQPTSRPADQPTTRTITKVAHERVMDELWASTSELDAVTAEFKVYKLATAGANG